VVGAGLVGFAAAIALRREGHHVDVRLVFLLCINRHESQLIEVSLDLRNVQLQNRARGRPRYSA
jgi:2-polyprenyl-6-methoxyphenol hydroxylase-like FAD-dependent oxidoreductase